MSADLERLRAALRTADAAALRSVADRLARQRHPDAVEPLLLALQHHDPQIRAIAAEAAGHLDSPDAVDPLFLLLQDPEPVVREGALAALLRLGPGLLERHLGEAGPPSPEGQRLEDLVQLLRGDVSPRAVKLCIALLHHDASAVRVAAAEVLGATQDRRAVDELIIALGHPDARTRVAAANALGEHGKTSRIVGPLIEAFRDPVAEVRETAALALSRFDVVVGSIPAARMRPVVEYLLRHGDVEARRRVVLMLGRSRGPEAVELLLPVLHDREPSVRAEAIVALGRFRDDRIEPALRVALTDAEEMVRLRAVDALERLGAPEPLPLALKDPSPLVRVQAIKALRWTGAEPVLPELLASLRDPAEAVRLEVVELLSAHPTPAVLAGLARALPNESFPLIRQKILATLSRDPDESDAALAAEGLSLRVRDALQTALGDPAPEVRAQAVQFLAERPEPELLPALLARRDDEAAEVRLALVKALEQYSPPNRAALDRFLADPSPEVRDAAVWALRARPVAEALGRALPLLGDPAEMVRLSVAVLLAAFHVRGVFSLSQLGEVYAAAPPGGRLALLEVCDGIRDRRLVPLLLGAVLHGEPSERARALQVLADLKRGEPARRHPRVAQEVYRVGPAPSVPARPVLRVPEPVVLAEEIVFVVSAPGGLAPGSLAVVRLWAALPGQLSQVEALARRPADDGDYRVQPRRSGARLGLSATLHAAGLEALDAEDDLPWDGEPAAARFLVRVPANVPPGPLPVRIVLHRAGIPIAETTTTLAVGPARPVGLWPVAERRIRQAVAVADPEDEEVVAARLAALGRVVPWLTVRRPGPGANLDALPGEAYVFGSPTVPLGDDGRRHLLPLEPVGLASADLVWAYLRGRLFRAGGERGA